MNQSLGLLETRGYTPAMVALDVMAKAATVRVLQAEINDRLGVILKIAGDAANVAAAIEAGRQAATEMTPDVVARVIRKVDAGAWRAIDSPAEHNPLIQQDVVHLARDESDPLAHSSQGQPAMAQASSQALGFIETQGFTAVFQAIDTACKAAQVEVVGKEKLGGGYVTVVVRGDVAAVHAAIAAGREEAGELGNLIAAHVIAHPSPAVLSLLPG